MVCSPSIGSFPHKTAEETAFFPKGKETSLNPLQHIEKLCEAWENTAAFPEFHFQQKEDHAKLLAWGLGA